MLYHDICMFKNENTSITSRHVYVTLTNAAEASHVLYTLYDDSLS